MTEEAGAGVDEDKKGGDAGNLARPSPAAKEEERTEKDTATDAGQAGKETEKSTD